MSKHIEQNPTRMENAIVRIRYPQLDQYLGTRHGRAPLSSIQLLRLRQGQGRPFPQRNNQITRLDANYPRKSTTTARSLQNEFTPPLQLPLAVDDTAFGQVVGAQLDKNLVAGGDANVVTPHLARD